MAHWLFKSEPSVWSFEMQVNCGGEGHGVERHPQPFRQAQHDGDELGERGFFYHSNEARRSSASSR